MVDLNQDDLDGDSHGRSGVSPFSRRRMLSGVGASMGALFAGCSTLVDDGPSEEQSFSQLHVTAVYVDDAVELSMPEEIETVRNTHNADLIILPDETDIEAQQAVEWLADDRTLALIGPNSEATWLGWARSDTFTDTFAEEGYADSNPDPYLLVAVKNELRVPTYRHSWSDTPRERDLLRALDEYLVKIETETRE